jgi:hypothetical protein
VLADADLLRDDLWRGDGATGESRQRRTSDNPLVIADLLDELAALDRPRALGDARWRTASRTLLGALLPTLLPLLALLLGAGGFALLRRRAR